MIRMKLMEDGRALFETLLIEDRADVGPQIRTLNAPVIDSDRSAVVDVPRDHCVECNSAIADLLGLTASDVNRLKRWREAATMTPDERREAGLTAIELGDILDHIVEQLDDERSCDEDTKRIVVEVESIP